MPTTPPNDTHDRTVLTEPSPSTGPEETARALHARDGYDHEPPSDDDDDDGEVTIDARPPTDVDPDAEPDAAPSEVLA